MLKSMFYKHILLASSRPGFKFFNELPMHFTNNSYSYFNFHCEWTFTKYSYCKSLLKYRHDQLHSFTSNNLGLIGIKQSFSQVGLCQANFNIQEFQKRYKAKKPQKRPEYDSDSDEDEDNESEVTKPLTLRVQSLRLDGLLKKAFNIARNKVETAFYEGNIRVNGTKPNKKSYQVKVGEEVDMIKGISPMNPKFLSVSRVEVISVKEDPDEDEEKLLVKIRRTKTLFVENYESDPWKKSTSAE